MLKHYAIEKNTLDLSDSIFVNEKQINLQEIENFIYSNEVDIEKAIDRKDNLYILFCSLFGILSTSFSLYFNNHLSFNNSIFCLFGGFIGLVFGIGTRGLCPAKGLKQIINKRYNFENKFETLLEDKKFQAYLILHLTQLANNPKNLYPHNILEVKEELLFLLQNKQFSEARQYIFLKASEINRLEERLSKKEKIISYQKVLEKESNLDLSFTNHNQEKQLIEDNNTDYRSQV